MNITTGIVDVHHDDGGYDLAHAAELGLVALVHKCTEGKDWRDPACEAALGAAQALGLLTGAYHFGSASAPGVVQADWFLQHARPGDLLALDLEHNPGSSGTMSTAEAAAFCQHVFDHTGRWPVFYAGLADLRNRMATVDAASRAILAQCPLWLAAYGPDPARTTPPAPWSSWSLMQYTNGADGPFDRVLYPRATAGFKRTAQDRSCFRGTADELRAWWSTVGS